jgi:HlyD family secretion protein
LGIIENPADYEDVYMLMNQMDSASNYLETPSFLSELKLKGDYHLGQVQPYYTAFTTSLDEYITTREFNIFEEKVLTLRRQSYDLEKYLQQLASQAGILEKKMVISRRQLSRDSLLFQQNAISETDLEKSRGEFLNQELNHRTAVATLVNNRMQLSQVKRQITEYQTQKSGQRNILFSTLKEKYENLVNQLRVWEQAYVLKTPVSGRVTFNNIWNINQQIEEGTAVFSVVPADVQELVGRIILPVSGSGKVKVNQKVNIKLDNYPYMEFGMLQGKITNISLVPVSTDKGYYYTAEVLLNQGLVTNSKRTLPFSQEMQGNAEIITDDRRLLMRMVAPLVSLYRERMLTD